MRSGDRTCCYGGREIKQTRVLMASRRLHALFGIAPWLLLGYGSALLAQPVPDALVRVLLALVLAFGIASAFVAARTRTAAQPRVVLVVLSLLLGVTPWVVPSDAEAARFVIACVAVGLFAKLYDLHVSYARGIRPAVESVLYYLPDFTTLVYRKLRAPPAEVPAADLARAVLSTTIAAVLVALVVRYDWTELGFYVEHIAKSASIFWLATATLSVAAKAAQRLGAPSEDFTRAPFAARTPAEFWRRYNRGVMQFFHENVFKRLAHSRGPVYSILLIFVISGVAHEYAFAAATGRVEGYQMTFFLLQGMGVAATIRLRPRGSHVAAGVAGTISFNVATSMFFFASVQGLVPLYVNPLPSWLAWWS